MKKQLISQPVAFVAGVVFVVPSLYFIISALLNYGFGIHGMWSLIEPIFDKPENKGLGFNVNLLIVFGPLLSLLINLPLVIHVTKTKVDDRLTLNLQFMLYHWSWLIITAALFCLASLGLYMIGENCNC
jgi:hypothetical protein